MKTKNRIKKLGEVFTPDDLVKQMADQIVDYSPDKTILDPTCGNAQILIEPLKRGHPIENLYGCDLMADNICDTIARLHYYNKFKIDLIDNKEFNIGHSENNTYANIKSDKSFIRVYGSKISVRYKHLNYGGAIVFEYSFDNTNWQTTFNLVCQDALKYNFDFDHKVFDKPLSLF